MTDNPAFVLRNIEDVVFEERPIQEPKEGEVLVAVKKTGICGSDVHYLLHGGIGDFIVKSPMVLGHESAGLVAKVGPGINHLKVGDRVAMEPGATCRKCEYCKCGRYELCPDIAFAATPPYDGTLQRYYRIPADLAYPIPDNMSLEDGALMEPLSVAVHAVHILGGLRACQSIMVFGCGPVGLLCMAVAKSFGASRIVGIDIINSRLEFAKQYAATDTFMPPEVQEGEASIAYSRRSADEMKRQLKIAGRGAGAIDLVIDASGAPSSIQTAIYVVKPGGTFVQVGAAKSPVEIDITTLVVKEITYKGSFRYGPGDYPLAISLVSQGRIDLKPLVTHRYAFTEAISAFKSTKTGKGDDGKIVIKAIISGPDAP
ncbi:hypothetical protein AMATHDRAFT_139010 [Amanita thiersii Skay4041]|uniref:Enoyl reductase (ER) domain-containing protein n=1 Tax=Amanita thiersii Skay4041 TaxID=703135 RepID=A0A2A9NY79_9AGAR|nr:hypothetical protein AMATHDRAFT_139010 [Amanita thiersii Skay4041]